MPFRKARPWLSLMMSATSVPVSAFRDARNRAQLASGSSGSSSAVSSVPFCSILDMSMPALAMTKPSLCATTRTSRRYRTTSVDSRRISSTRRGSLLTSHANCCAASEGAMLSRRTRRPSAFETIFCASTRTSPSHSFSCDAASAARMIAVRSSPGLTIGRPASATKRASGALAVMARW